MSRFIETERVGVNVVERIFLSEFNWIPRTVFQTDVGIDMIVEISVGGMPTGKFLGVQIKSGESYFTEQQGNEIVFRSNATHIDYWLNNAMPILIVLHNPATNITIWQAIKPDTAINTGKGYRINIPLTNILSHTSKEKIERLTKVPPLFEKFQQLLLDKSIIDLVAGGAKIVVNIDSWVNKSSGRADIRIIHVITDSDYMEGVEEESEILAEFTAIGVHSYSSLYYFYPWADLKTDMAFYEEFSDYDEDYMPGYKIVFIEDRFHGYKLPIVPYKSNDEVASYRLKMSLNDYGKTFLDFYDYINGNKQMRLDFEAN
jgi:hypothetical protein